MGGHPRQFRPQFLQGQARKRGIQQGAQQLQLGLRQGGRQAEELILHHLAIGHQHSDERRFLHHEQVIAGDGGFSGPLGQGKGGILGQLGDDLPRLRHHLVHFPDFEVESFVDLLGLLHGQPVLLHEFVHIQPVSLGRGNPSGGGMGLFQVTQGLQLRHLIADGGGGDLQAGADHNGFGAHRFGGLYVVFYHRAKDLFFALRQFHSQASFGLFYHFSTHSP